MTIVCPLHAYYRPGHLETVIEQMRALGPPRLRGYHDVVTGAYLMREGTHRLRAALALGFAPIIVPIPWWRSKASQQRAREAAKRYGHLFPRVTIEGGSSHG